MTESIIADSPHITIDIRQQRGAFNLDVSVGLGGGLTAFYGRSGSGKTTLINALAGLTTPDSGSLSVGDQMLFDAGRKINVAPEKRRMGYVFQDGRLFPHLSAKANLLYARRFISSPLDQTLFEQIVDLLGIAQLLDRRPTTLSGGEKQRIAIGRALLSEPRLLLMDEPLASLDTNRKAEILPFIESLRNQLKIPILYVSHAMEEVIRLADHLVVLEAGQVAADGTVEHVMGRLDLKPLTGRYEAGAVIEVKVEAHDPIYDLTRLSFASHTLLIPKVELEIGSNLRLRIRARDVSLSTEKPIRTSVLNVLEATITDIAPEGGAHCDVLMDVGAPLIARITRKSVDDLGLAIGKKVYASIKAAAINRHNLGLSGTKAQ